MVFWRVQFADGSLGYQVMDSGLNLIGVFDDKGRKLASAGDYSTIDSGSDPNVGVSAPAWAGKIDV